MGRQSSGIFGVSVLEEVARRKAEEACRREERLKKQRRLHYE